MRVDLPLALVWAFLAVFARIAGMVAFVPIPGLKTPVDPPRILLCVLVTLALFPRWPVLAPSSTPIASIATLAAGEAVFGLFAGLVVGIFIELFQLAAQLLAQQAGFSYASTIDPSNDTDSGVLQVLCQLLAGLLAISAGLDRHILHLFSQSLEHVPPGSFTASFVHLQTATHLAGRVFETGFLLALPSIAIFIVLDVLLAVLSRLEQQLQLTSILFPVKTASAVFVATLTIGNFPAVFERVMEWTLRALRTVTGS